MERDSAQGAIQPGLKILAQYAQTRLGFSARPNWPENLEKFHVIETEFQPGPKREREHAHWLCFGTSVNFLTEICVLRPGWNWTCNRNNISAPWAERNFSQGWNSPCNQALSDKVNEKGPRKHCRPYCCQYPSNYVHFWTKFSLNF